MKTIRTDFLIKQMASNLEKEFSIKQSEISNHITSLLKGVVHHATVAGNLEKQFKHNHNSKTKCKKCGKRVKDMELHNIFTHKAKTK